MPKLNFSFFASFTLRFRRGGAAGIAAALLAPLGCWVYCASLCCPLLVGKLSIILLIAKSPRSAKGIGAHLRRHWTIFCSASFLRCRSCATSGQGPTHPARAPLLSRPQAKLSRCGSTSPKMRSFFD